MSRKSDLARLEFILEMIKNITFIAKRHGSVKNALKDIEGQNAVFMCLIQIGEKIKRIESEDLKEKLPVKEASAVRNFIVHDYSGVDLEIIKEIIESDLPMLEKIVKEILL